MVINCGPQPDFIGHVIVKQRIHIRVVHPFRSCRHPQPELRGKESHHPLIARRRGPVRFIDEDEIKRRGRKMPLRLFLRHRLHRCKEVLGVPVVPVTTQNSKGTCRSPEHPVKTFPRLKRNFFPVHDEQEPPRPERLNGKRSQVRLAGPGRRHHERPAFAPFPGRLQGG